MKFLAVADSHLGCKLLNVPELEADLDIEYEKAVAKAIELKVNYFISVGDLFDNNEPSAFTIDFVRGLNKKLRKKKIIPLALAGDHSKSLDGKNWEQVCDFDTINSVPEFIGIDYDDNPAHVMALLAEEAKGKPLAQFIFLHGQIQELWPFPDEKKLLPVREFLVHSNLNHLKGVILGDIHKPFEATMKLGDQSIYFGYCGSTGVTATDEFGEKRYIVYNGEELETISYDTNRVFKAIEYTSEWLANLTQVAKDELVDYLKSLPVKPFIIVKFTPETKDKLPQLAFLYDHAIVRTTRVKKDSAGNELTINLRSNLSTVDRKDAILRTIPSISGTERYTLTSVLLDNPDGAKDTLDRYKEKAFA